MPSGKVALCSWMCYEFRLISWPWHDSPAYMYGRADSLCYMYKKTSLSLQDEVGFVVVSQLN
jgi:hypothetical protein